MMILDSENGDGNVSCLQEMTITRVYECSLILYELLKYPGTVEPVLSGQILINL